MAWPFRWHYPDGDTPSQWYDHSQWYDDDVDCEFGPDPGVTIEWRKVPGTFVPGYYRTIEGSLGPNTVYWMRSQKDLDSFWPSPTHRYERVEVASFVE